MLQEAALRVLVALQNLRSKTQDERGQTLAEYGLIVAVIAVAIVVTAMVGFRGAIVGQFDKSANCLNGGAGCS